MLKSQKRSFGRMLCCLLLALMVSFQAALAVETAESRSQMIRVKLTKLNLTDRLDVTLTAPYLLTTESGVRMHFENGSQLSFQLKDASIYLYYQGMTQKLGTQMKLQRSSAADMEKTGFCRTNFPALYLGDLQLDIEENKLRPILSIHVEDYLLGVVPYEMSDSFPVEALKAQAVAARTYALRSQNQYDDYDVVDNTNDQVFYGYVSGNSNAEQAVEETRGVCGFYKGSLAQCYYAASNGGQTELVQTVWPTKGDYDYYSFGEDPYDVANPESVVRSFVIARQYSGETAPYALRKLVAERMADTLQSSGYDASPESIQIDAVTQVAVDTPNMYGSKRMTMLHLAMQISVRTKREAFIRVIDQDLEEVSLFTAAAPAETAGTFAPVVTLAPTAAPEPDYGPFTAWSETVWIDLPIFTEAEDVFGLDILGNYDNEIWSVVETEDSFTIEARRYGHGVGMSQRGAQWMAAQHGKTYEEILAFYYPGMQLLCYPEQERAFVETEEALVAGAGPAPSPTPRPTPVPVTLMASEGEWFAVVTEIADDSSLNMRAEPTLNAKILDRLYKGQRLLVVERCPEEGWVHVRTDTLDGYVMERYLTIEDQ